MQEFPIKSAKCKPVGTEQEIGWDTAITCNEIGIINAIYEDNCE
jgi:hypothetical protein